MNPLDLLRDLPPPIALVVIALVGRTALAWTPAGHPGAHSPARLPVTWASSHVLGVALLALQFSALETLGWSTSVGLLFTPWVLAAAVRWITLPGTMVPRHEPPRATNGSRARFALACVLALTLAGLLVIALRGPASPRARWLEAASFPATLLMISWGLATTRRITVGRHWIVAGFAFTPLCFLSLWRTSDALPMTQAALWASTGAAALAWLRRADSRGRALALLSLAGLPALAAAWLPAAAGALIALVATTAKPSRLESAKLAAMVLLLSGGPAVARMRWESARASTPMLLGDLHRGADAIWFSVWTAAVVLVPWCVGRALRDRAQSRLTVDESRLEIRFLLAAGGLACLGMLPVAAPALSFGCLAALPALLTGLRSLPGERAEPVR